MNHIQRAVLALKTKNISADGIFQGNIVEISTHGLARDILRLSQIIKPEKSGTPESRLLSLYRSSHLNVDNLVLKIAVDNFEGMFGKSLKEMIDSDGVAETFASIDLAYSKTSKSL